MLVSRLCYDAINLLFLHGSSHACRVGLSSMEDSKSNRRTHLRYRTIFNAICSSLGLKLNKACANVSSGYRTSQMVDSGLDETSCFFADDDGVQVKHGHIYDGVQVEDDGNISTALRNPSFQFDMSRRKVQRGVVECHCRRCITAISRKYDGSVR